LLGKAESGLERIGKYSCTFRALFQGLGAQFWTYRNAYQLGTFVDGPELTRIQTQQLRTFSGYGRYAQIRALLTLYSMLFVRDWANDKVFGELTILSHLLGTNGDHLAALANFFSELDNCRRAERCDLPAAIHERSGHLHGTKSGQQRLISLHDQYLTYCLSNLRGLRAAAGWQVRKAPRLTTATPKTKKLTKSQIVQCFLHTNPSLATIKYFNKHNQYRKASELSAQYIDEALKLSKSVGNRADFQLFSYYIALTYALTKIDDWHGVKQRLRQFFALPKSFIDECPPAGQAILHSRLRKSQNILDSRRVLAPFIWPPGNSTG
jgi:hypothetical protein